MIITPNSYLQQTLNYNMYRDNNVNPVRSDVNSNNRNDR